MTTVKLHDVKTQSDIDAATSQGRLAVLHFWASWCEPCTAMDAVLAQLAKEHPAVTMLRVEAEAVDEVTMKYQIASVPTFVFLRGNTVVAMVEGADPPALTAQLDALDLPATAATASQAAAAAPPAAAAAAPASAGSGGNGSGDVNGRIKYLLSSHPVILFMKGNPETPRCGFSRKVVEALQATQVPFQTFDILTDEAIRQGLKEYANWPTYPQLFVQGELMGGCDIVLEMAASGELKQELNVKVPTSSTTAATAAAAAYPHSAPAAGTSAPAAARSELHPPASSSAAAVAAVASGNGSSDHSTPSGLPPDLHARIDALVKSQPVMLFMKGNPEAPRCGFSSKVVAALRDEGVAFGSFDILSDDGVRQGLKEYASWPTFPQVFVRGELLGGCDIVLEKAAAKELGSDIQEMLHRMEDVAS